MSATPSYTTNLGDPIFALKIREPHPRKPVLRTGIRYFPTEQGMRAAAASLDKCNQLPWRANNQITYQAFICRDPEWDAIILDRRKQH